MPDKSETAEDLIRKHAPEVADQIKKAAQEAWGNEAQFRGNLARGRVFESFAEHLELTLQPREEYTLINGRADAVYNRFVIEYEPPGSLTPRDSRRNSHAADQVQQYIEGLAKKERHRPERLAGVATDGCYFIFARFRSGVFHTDPPLPVAADSTARFLASLYLLSTEKALTAENLVRDFGENTNVARIAVSALYQTLCESQNAKIGVIYDQWRQQFSQVCGYEEGSQRLDVRRLARQYAIQDPRPSAFRLFFAIHTYYATFIKLLAVQVVHYYMAPKLGTALPQVANYPSDRLHVYLKDMECGGIFKQLGIGNFLEGDFFGWYLENWHDALDKGIRRIVSELAHYSLVTLDADPDQTRDLLKKLYQNVMPKQLRHDLGEYYTPDWLAERLLNQLGFASDYDSALHTKRLLDPACGSGTFLVLAIRRVKEHCAERPIKPSDLLYKIQSNIVGFDLNPLAVISARTNYLLALGDLLESTRDFEVNIPVYLCDSILTPSRAEDKAGDQYRMMGSEEHLYKFKTVVGEFAVPSSLVRAQYIDQLAQMVEECVDAKYSVDNFRSRLLHTFPLMDSEDAIDIQVLEQLYSRIKELDERAINGIWARIIKNAFAPMFCGRFDYVAGNPPWVNWEYLPDEYRKQLIPLNQERYKLFLLKGAAARHGSAGIDLSTLMLYVSADQYLASGGKLGFIITQSLFKTGAGSGFRRFQIEGGAPLKVLFVDDMKELQPFEGANNRTSVIILQKGQLNKYPVQYAFWRKAKKGLSIPQDASLITVQGLTRTSQWVASPILSDTPTSSWLTGKARAVDALKQCIGRSTYRAHKGICGYCNGAYWVSIVSKRPDGLVVIANLTELGEIAVEPVQAAIEPDCVYPLLRGKDFQRWRPAVEIYSIVPHDPLSPLKGYPEDVMRIEMPKLYAYFKRFEALLRGRSGFKKYFNPSADPFYSIYDIRDYTFEPFKVVWKALARGMIASVVSSITDGYLGEKIIIPEHNTVFVSVDSASEAHYLCALLNCSIASYLIVSTISLFYSTNVLDYVRVPAYEASNQLHSALSQLSQDAHQAEAAGDKQAVASIEQRIDELAAEVWELTRDEAKEIQDSLKELRS